MYIFAFTHLYLSQIHSAIDSIVCSFPTAIDLLKYIDDLNKIIKLIFFICMLTCILTCPDICSYFVSVVLRKWPGWLNSNTKQPRMRNDRPWKLHSRGAKLLQKMICHFLQFCIKINILCFLFHVQVPWKCDSCWNVNTTSKFKQRLNSALDLRSSFGQSFEL